MELHCQKESMGVWKQIKICFAMKNNLLRFLITPTDAAKESSVCIKTKMNDHNNVIIIYNSFIVDFVQTFPSLHVIKPF